MQQAIHQILPRILRDMQDGVLALDTKGNIIYLNAQGQEMLGETERLIGTQYANFMMRSGTSENDAFHELILDAVYDKGKAHNSEVIYRRADQEKRCLKVTTSFLFGEDGESRMGVVAVFSDITEVARLNRQKKEATAIFTILMVCVSFYIFLWSFLRSIDSVPPTWIMTKIIETISLLMLPIILKTTSFSIHDIGLKVSNPKATFVPDILIAMGIVIVMSIAKAVILKVAPGFFPANTPFLNWSNLGPSDAIYIFTAILQEFLARGVMQENLRRIFTGKNGKYMSIVISALLFGVMHVAHGFTFMIGATVLLGTLGLLYNKQRNIWGLSIIHFVFGEAAVILGFI